MHTQAVDDSQHAEEIVILWATGSIRPQQEFHQHLIPKALQLYMWPLRKYSEFITFPIELFNEKVQYDQVPDESAPPPKEGEKQKMKSVPRSVYEWDIMNKMKSTGLCTDICFLFVYLALFVICFIQLYIGPPRTALQILL